MSTLHHLAWPEPREVAHENRSPFWVKIDGHSPPAFDSSGSFLNLSLEDAHDGTPRQRLLPAGWTPRRPVRSPQSGMVSGDHPETSSGKAKSGGHHSLSSPKCSS